MLKEELREIIRERKRQFTGDQLERLSLSVVDRLKGHPVCLKASTILLYQPLPDEVNVSHLLTLMAEKTLLLPRVTEHSSMELRLYTGLDSLVKGAFGIMEPTGQPYTDYQKIDVAIIPGMAFDIDGHRLGRGRGYYDRFLTQIPKARKIGVCFPFQLVDKVPTEQTDIQMDEIIY